MASEMVTKVANAMINAYFSEDCWDSLVEADYDRWLAVASAAIEAMRTPTEAMLKAGDVPGWDDNVSAGLAAEVWSAMISASLQPDQPKE